MSDSARLGRVGVRYYGCVDETVLEVLEECHNGVVSSQQETNLLNLITSIGLTMSGNLAMKC